MGIIACQNKRTSGDETTIEDNKLFQESISPPLITDNYTADPSAHVFNGKIYLYPSHDIDSGTPENDNGDHFDMNDYHVYSMDSVGGKVTDHGVTLSVNDVPWAKKQLWAPDAAYKDGQYFLYFPTKDQDEIFRIGVATSSSPSGPFKAEKTPVARYPSTTSDAKSAE
ncbi:family 43 glycosylhydrolase [Olivibacter sp. SDN3]|nr:family 43 glycosylhydrolase [Olivibacter sp. SDN3]